MTFFVDANVFLYSAVPSERREPCLEVLRAIARGDASGRTSVAVLRRVDPLDREGVAGLLT